MTPFENKILFSIDLEEFDIPEEYGQRISKEEKLGASMQGMLRLYELFQTRQLKTTVFSTAYFAEQQPELVRMIAKDHEIGSHTYNHSSFNIDDLALSRKALQQITGQEIYGLRMPRMGNVDPVEIKKAGYLYDSSLNPTWIPGRYNHLNKPRTAFFKNEIWEIPVSVTPLFRLPVFWLAFKNFPLGVYKNLCETILKKDKVLVTYVHPWEFSDLSKYKLPFYIKRLHGERLVRRLEKLIDFLQYRGEFISHMEWICYLQSIEKPDRMV